MESHRQNDSRESESVGLVRNVKRRQLPETSEQPTGKKGCIFRVETTIREENPESYTPRVIGIGPFHHGRFPDMEVLKVKYTEEFLAKANVAFDAVQRKILENVVDIENCYEGLPRYHKNQFVSMMVYDGCFILEHLLRVHRNSSTLSNSKLRRDFVLIENQVPLSMLEKIYSLVPYSGISFSKLIFHYFKDFNVQEIEPADVRQEHFTDLLRYFLLPPWAGLAGPQERTTEILPVYTASELLGAGVRFGVSESKCLFDITFNGRELKIPRLEIDTTTEIYFRNLLAFEDQCYRGSGYITDYFYFLKLLVEKDEDAKILMDRNIIESRIGGPSEVATTIQNLRSTTIIHNVHLGYVSLCQRLNAFEENPDNRMKARLERVCSPWKILVGCILGLLFVMQYATYGKQ